MRQSTSLRWACLVSLALTSSHLFAISGSGTSAAGSLDTVAPVAGSLTAPAAVATTAMVNYSGASDASGIARVELWAREDAASWAFTSLFETAVLGFFNYTPGATGTYYFELVAEDTLGNRSAAPSGSIGTGQATTNFHNSVEDWSLFN
ncbi:MAG: hypothetical protein SF028_06420 [Candidatus Sumerlaeia bacterium]|nr:hypothetical protein [Candidatus Sumerlaeia bacterium]